jgi:hypothetical protein
MQTFLPFPDFARSAEVLDDRRLGKQRVEALQILRALTREKYGWQHHPAVLMWSGFEEALAWYGLAMCEQWVVRGRPDSCAESILADVGAAGISGIPRRQPELAAAGALPPWLGDERLHASHRSSLLRKDPGHYGRYFAAAPADLPYHWPVRSSDPRR